MKLEDASSLLSNWIKECPAAVAAQRDALEHYGRLFRPDNLSNITRDEFRAFLVFKNNKHWANIQRQPNIYSDMPRLQRALAELLDESEAIERRLDTIVDRSGPLYIKGLGKAVLTPILLCVYPDKYAVYNTISDKGLTQLGLNTARSTDSFGKRYVAINEACHRIANKINRSLALIDMMFSLMIRIRHRDRRGRSLRLPAETLP